MKPVGAPLALVTLVFGCARKVCIVGVIKFENLMEPHYRGPSAQKHMRRRRSDAVSLTVRRLARQMEDNADFYMP